MRDDVLITRLLMELNKRAAGGATHMPIDDVRRVLRGEILP